MENAGLRALILVKLPGGRLPEAVRRHDHLHVWSIFIRLQNPRSAYAPVHGTTRLHCEGPPPPWRTQSRCAFSCERDSLYLEG
jgi:hypothetical protein